MDKKDLLKKLWTLKSKIGMPEEDFRALVSGATGKESTRELEPKEFEKIFKIMDKAFPGIIEKKPPRKKSVSVSKDPKVVAIPTPDQRSKVTQLLGEIKKQYPNLSAESMSQRMFRKSYRLLSKHQTQSLIEALKSMSSRVASP